MTRRALTIDDIESLAVGAWVLGTGGGGNPYLPLLNMRALYRDGHRVELMDAADLADDDWVGMAGGMGAPLVGQERLTDSRALSRAVALMEQHIGRPFAALMSVEIGGGNGVRPLMAAALLGRPVVDSDPMGRAYPEAQMSSMAIAGVEPGALAAVDVRGLESIVHRVPDFRWAERIARKICIEYGSTATICKPRTGAQVRKYGIHGTTTKAIAIGRAVREAQRRHEDPVAAILAAEPGKLLYKGKVIDVARRTTDGYLRGVVRFEGLDDFRGAALTINFQNEWIVALREGGDPVAMSPDLICVLDTDSGEAVGSETIRYGQRVTVIALPAPEVYLSPKGLEHVGPRAFGYDFDFKSVFA